MDSLRASALAGRDVLLFYVVVVSVALAVALLPATLNLNLGTALPLLVGCVVAYGVMLKLTRARLADMGVPPPRPSTAGFLRGAALGIAMAILAVGLAVVWGGARIGLEQGSIGALAGSVLQVGLLLTAASLYEELMFRGFPLVRLAQVWGKVGASLVLAALFSALHLFNPEVSTAGLFNIGVASLALSAAFFTPGGLPAAWGVHLGWNGGLALGFDAPVSGLSFDLPVIDYLPGQIPWVTGGTFGPEGGVSATVALTVGLVWLVRRAMRVSEGRTA